MSWFKLLAGFPQPTGGLLENLKDQTDDHLHVAPSRAGAGPGRRNVTDSRSHDFASVTVDVAEQESPHPSHWQVLTVTIVAADGCAYSDRLRLNSQGHGGRDDSVARPPAPAVIIIASQSAEPGSLRGIASCQCDELVRLGRL